MATSQAAGGSALMAMPYFLIDGLFTRGEFLQLDARATAAALFQFGWGVPAFVLIRILSPGFFARGDTRTPMTFALVSVAVNAALAFALFYGGMGVPGIAAAVSGAAWANALLLGFTLWRTGYWRPGPAVVGCEGQALDQFEIIFKAVPPLPTAARHRP